MPGDEWQTVRRLLLGRERTSAYGYLLGMYLGDGHISPINRTYRLRLTLDTHYPGIIKEAREALSALLPGSSSSIHARRLSAAADIAIYSRELHALFPQHGSGPKHRRRIVLLPWQKSVCAEAPKSLVRGLIHSDGCRYTATQAVGERTYRYDRYAFSNLSFDITAILCRYLDVLGVRWTRPSPVMVQVARRESVRLMDGFIGPKM